MSLYRLRISDEGRQVPLGLGDGAKPDSRIV